MNELGFEKDLREYNTIKEESKLTKIISVSAILFTVIIGLIAYLIDRSRGVNPVSDKLEDTFMVLNVIVIVLLIMILGIKKTIYYSPRLIKEEDSLKTVLRQWRKIDLSLITAAQLVPIVGFILTITGIEFRRTTHFFIAAVLLIIMLMPMGIKVRSRLKVLKKYFTNIL